MQITTSDLRSAVYPAGSDTGAPLTVRKRLELMLRYVNLEGRTILDAGCGAGAYVETFSRHSPNVFGVEYQADKVRDYRARTGRSNVTVGSVEQTGFPDKTFDVILSNEVLEHVTDDRRALSEMYRILKPGGYLFLFTPNRLYPLETHGCYTHSGKRIPSRVPFIPWLPLPLAGRFLVFWCRNYWRGDLKRMVEETGFRVVAYRTIWQTLSNTTGKQSWLLRRLSPLLRVALAILERTPVLRRFGISHLFVCVRNSR